MELLQSIVEVMGRAVSGGEVDIEVDDTIMSLIGIGPQISSSPNNNAQYSVLADEEADIGADGTIMSLVGIGSQFSSSQNNNAQSSALADEKPYNYYNNTTLFCLYRGCEGMKFKQRADLARHYKYRHAPHANRPCYSCDYPQCNRSKDPFHQRDHLRDHLREVHKEILPSRSEIVGEIDAESNNTSLTWWRCSKCLQRNTGQRFEKGCSLCSELVKDKGKGPAFSHEARRPNSHSEPISSMAQLPITELLQSASNREEFPEIQKSNLKFPSATRINNFTADSNHSGYKSLSAKGHSEANCENESLWLSVKDLSEINISEYTSKQTQGKALRLLLNLFAQSRGAINFCQSGIDTTRTTHMGALTSKGKNQSSTQQTTTSSSNNQSKRKHQAEERDHNDSNHNKKKKGRQRKGPTGQRGGKPNERESQFLFACPFHKWKPLTYRSCRKFELKSISRLKGHFWRCHDPIYCMICFDEFPTEPERDLHVRQRICEPQEPKSWEGITSEQKQKLKKRADCKKTPREQWNAMYEILFPGYPIPESPYKSEEIVSDELDALQTFMAEQWPYEYSRFVNGGIPEEFQGHDEKLQAFSTSLFEGAVNRVMRRFEQSNSQRNALPTSSAGDNQQLGCLSPRPPTPTISSIAISTSELDTEQETLDPSVALPNFVMDDLIDFDFAAFADPVDAEFEAYLKSYEKINREQCNSQTKDDGLHSLE